MALSDDIRSGMTVKNANGETIGVVDRIDNDRIKLTARDSTDGNHHYVARSDVTRVDEHVHVSTTGRPSPTALPPQRKRRGLFGWLLLIGIIFVLALWLAGSFDNIDDGARGITDTGQFSEGGNTAR